MRELNEIVIDKLNKYMNEKNISQYQLASLSGVPYPTLKSIMQRRTNDIKLKTIVMLCSGLGITIKEFIGDDFSMDNIIM